MDENTRYDQLAHDLSNLGGEGVLKILDDLESFRAKAKPQDKALVTSARMIKPEFGELKFSELSAKDIQTRFNALYGSNTRPRSVIKQGFNEKMLGQTVYFDRLDRVKFEDPKESEILIDELKETLNIPEGALHWNSKKDKTRVFIKCKGDKKEWVYFNEITLSGSGKNKAHDFMIKYMENKPYN